MKQLPWIRIGYSSCIYMCVVYTWTDWGGKIIFCYSGTTSTAGMEMKDQQSFADPDASEVKTALDEEEPSKVELA